MPKPQLRLTILMLMGVLLVGACNSLKLFQSADDKTITTSIQAKLFSDPVLKTRDVRVDSRNGTVTLSGTVGTDLEKAAVERIAAQEDGVKNVVNMLGVASSAAMAAPDVAQTTESATPPQEVAPSPAQPAQPAPEKPSHRRHAQPASRDDNASAALHAYTDSVAPASATNSAPAPGPTPTAAAPTPAAPPTVSAAPAPPPPEPTPAPKPQERLIIPEGTVLTVRMVDSIDSSRNKPGEEFAATLDSPIVVGDRVVASRGADARVRLATAKSAGHIEGQSQLQLELINVTINGVPYETHSGYYEQHGGSRGTRSAETIGGGAVVGALLGGIFGHGKGAAIGSIAGAGAGTAVQVSTKGQQVKIPSETKLDFTLTNPVTVAMGVNN